MLQPLFITHNWLLAECHIQPLTLVSETSQKEKIKGGGNCQVATSYIPRAIMDLWRSPHLLKLDVHHYQLSPSEICEPVPVCDCPFPFPTFHFFVKSNTDKQSHSQDSYYSSSLWIPIEGKKESILISHCCQCNPKIYKASTVFNSFALPTHPC